MFSPFCASHLSSVLLLVPLLAGTRPSPPEDAPAEEPSPYPPAPQPRPLPGRSEFVDNGLVIPAGTRAELRAGDDPVELVLVDGEVRRVRFNYYVD